VPGNVTQRGQPGHQKRVKTARMIPIAHGGRTNATLGPVARNKADLLHTGISCSLWFALVLLSGSRFSATIDGRNAL
jgi:hypothetical protein